MLVVCETLRPLYSPFAQMALSKQVKKAWGEETLVQALDELKYGKISFREASAKYGMPKSTLRDYATGKIVVEWWLGSQPVLTRDEEKRLVEWTIELAHLGYGQTRRQICEMVKKIFKKRWSTQSFQRKQTWQRLHSFNKIRKSLLEQRQHWNCQSNGRLCTELVLLHGLDGKPDRIWNCDESGFPLRPKSGNQDCVSCQETTFVVISASWGIFHIFPGKRFILLKELLKEFTLAITQWLDHY